MITNDSHLNYCIFFENEEQVLYLNFYEEQVILRWRIKGISIENMQKWEEEIVQSFISGESKRQQTPIAPVRVQAEYEYTQDNGENYRSKNLIFFLLFGRDAEDALDTWDATMHSTHSAFVASNQEHIALVTHIVDATNGLSFFVQADFKDHPNNPSLRELCFSFGSTYFPQNFFARLLHETCVTSMSEESAQEIMSLAESKKVAYFNQT